MICAQHPSLTGFTVLVCCIYYINNNNNMTIIIILISWYWICQLLRGFKIIMMIWQLVWCCNIVLVTMSLKHFIDIACKLGMCRIDFLSVRFLKNLGFGSERVRFGSKMLFGSNIIVIYYSRNSWVVNLQQILTATVDVVTLTSLATTTKTSM